jgi:hypothetical protein
VGCGATSGGETSRLARRRRLSGRSLGRRIARRGAAVACLVLMGWWFAVWLRLADDDRSPDGYDGLAAASFELEVLARVRAEPPTTDRPDARRAVQLIDEHPASGAAGVPGGRLVADVTDVGGARSDARVGILRVPTPPAESRSELHRPGTWTDVEGAWEESVGAARAALPEMQADHLMRPRTS